MPTSAICIIDTSFAPTQNKTISHLMKTSIFALKKKRGSEEIKDTLPLIHHFSPRDKCNLVSGGISGNWHQKGE
jgi:hypothetical protein